MNTIQKICLLIIFMTSCNTLDLSKLRSHEKKKNSDVLITNPERITVGTSDSYSPYITNDKKYIYYSSYDDKNKDIWRREIRTGKTKRITYHAADDMDPKISPDGKFLAFISRRDDAAGDVHFLKIPSETTERILGSEFDVSRISSESTVDTDISWFPTSDRFVFSSRTPGSRKARLVIADVNDLSMKKLEGIYGEQPSVSSDGESLLYVNEGDIYQYSFKDKKSRNITNSPKVQEGHPVFSSNNKKIVFIKYMDDTNADGVFDAEDRPTLWSLSLAGENIKQFAKPLTSADFIAYSPKAVDDELFFTGEHDGELDIFKLPISGQLSERLPIDIDREKELTYNQVVFFYRSLIARSLNNRNLDKAFSRGRWLLYYFFINNKTQEYQMLHGMMMGVFSGDTYRTKILNALNIEYKIQKLIFPYNKTNLNSRENKELQKQKEALSKITAGKDGSEINHLLKYLFAKIDAGSRNYDKALSLEGEHADLLLQCKTAIYVTDLFQELSSVENITQKYSDLYGMCEDDAVLSSVFLRRFNLFIKKTVSPKEYRSLLEGERLRPEIKGRIHLLLAKTYLENKDYFVAGNELKQVIKDYGDILNIRIEAMSLYIKTMEKEGLLTEIEEYVFATLASIDKEDAEWSYKKARALLMDYLLSTAKVLAKQKKIDESVKKYLMVLAFDENNLQANKGLIDSYYVRGELSHVVETLTHNLKSKQVDVEEYYIWSYAKTYEIDTESSIDAKIATINEIITVLETIKAKFYKSFHLYQTLGWLYFQKNHFQNKQEKSGIIGSLKFRYRIVKDFFSAEDDNVLEKSLESYLSAYSLSEKGSIERAQVSQNLAEAYYVYKNYNKALSYYLQRIKSVDEYPLSDVKLEANLYRKAGRSAFHVGKLDLAIYLQNESLKLWEESNSQDQIQFALSSLALSCREDGRYDKAFELYNKQWEEFSLNIPNDVSQLVLFNKAYTKYQAKEYDISLDLLDKFLKFDLEVKVPNARRIHYLKNKALVYTMRSHILEKQGMLRESYESLLRKQQVLTALQSEEQERSDNPGRASEYLFANQNKIAHALFQFEEYEKSQKSYRASLSHISSDGEYSIEKWYELLNLANIAIRKSNIQRYSKSESLSLIADLKKGLRFKNKDDDSKNVEIALPLKQRINDSIIALTSIYDSSNLEKVIEDYFYEEKSEANASPLKLSDQMVAAIGKLPDSADLKIKYLKEYKASIKNMIKKEDSTSYVLSEKEMHLEYVTYMNAATSRGYYLKGDNERFLLKYHVDYLVKKNPDDFNLFMEYENIKINSFVNRVNSLGLGSKLEKIKTISIKDIKNRLSDDQAALYTYRSLNKQWLYVFYFTKENFTQKAFKLNGQQEPRAALSQFLRAQEATKHLYIMPSDDLFDLEWESLTQSVQKTTISFVPSPFYLTKRQGDFHAPVILGLKVKNEEKTDEQGYFPSANFKTAFENNYLNKFQLIDFSDELLIEPSRFLSSYWKGQGKPKLLADLFSIRLRGVSGIIFPNISLKGNRHFSTVQPWVNLYLLGQKIGVDTVIMGGNSVFSDTFYQGLNKQSFAEAAINNKMGLRVLGYEGLSLQGVKAFSDDFLEDLLEEAEEKLDDEKWKEAAKLYGDIYDIYIRTGEEDLEEVLSNLVVCYFKMGDFERALFFQDKIISIVDEGSLLEHLIGAANLSVRIEKFKLAKAYFDRAEAILSSDKQSIAFAKFQRDKAILYEKQSLYDDTIKSYLSSYQIYAKKSLLDDAAKILLNIGNVYALRMSDFNRALKYYSRSYELYKKIDKKDLMATTQIDRANALLSIGEFEKSIAILKATFKFFNQKDLTASTIRSSQILSNGYFSSGDYLRALSQNRGTFLKLEKIKKQKLRASYTIDALNLKAMIYGRMTRIKDAYRVFDEALEMADKNKFEAQKAAIFNNKGYWLRETLEIDESIILLEKALRIDRRLKSDKNMAFDLRNLAFSVLLKGNLGRAKKLLNRSLILSEKTRSVYNHIYVYFGLAEIAVREASFAAARSHLLKATKLAEKYKMWPFLWRAYAGIAITFRAESEFDKSLKWYKKSIKTASSHGPGGRIYSSGAGLLSEIGVQEVYDAIIELQLEKGDENQVWLWTQKSKNSLYQDSTLGLSGRSHLLEEGNSISSLRKRIGVNQTLIEYKITSDYLITFIIKKNNFWMTSLKMKSDSLKEDIARYTALIDNYSSVGFMQDKLSGVLIRPIEKYLNGKGHLVIVPDQWLYNLSFVTLKSQKKIILDQYTVSYLPHSSMMKSFSKKKNRRIKNILAIGNSYVNNSEKIPFVKKEVEAMKRYFPVSIVEESSEGAKATLIKKSSSFDVVHLAAHGSFDRAVPLNSYISISHDGSSRLTLKDMGLAKFKSSLFVLSACETGAGILSRGNEVISMSRTLLKGGVGAVVSSLWRVSDVANAIVMKRFYRYLSEGLSKADALRKSQMNTKKFFRHPAYWGGFRIEGDL